MLSCKDESRGFFVYRCESCGTFVTVHFGCNSRICTNCGKNHTDKWAKSLKKTMFNVPHRHAVLTIPDALWLIVRGNRFLLKVLMDAAIQAINDTISHKHRNGNLTAGAIVVLHPFHPVAEIPGPRTIPAPPSGAEGSGACFRLVRMRQHGDAQREPEYARSRQPRRLSLPWLKSRGPIEAERPSTAHSPEDMTACHAPAPFFVCTPSSSSQLPPITPLFPADEILIQDFR